MNFDCLLEEILKLLSSLLNASEADIIIRKVEKSGSRILYRTSVNLSERKGCAGAVREVAAEQGLLFKTDDQLQIKGSGNYPCSWYGANLPHGLTFNPRGWCKSIRGGRGVILRAEQYGVEVIPTGGCSYHLPDGAAAGAVTRCLEIIGRILPVIELEELPSVLDHGEARGCPAADFDPPLIGCSKETARLRADIVKIAESDISVLIGGESGTGKEVVAANIHRLSSRSTGPLVKVNCAEIQPSLLRAELFGFRRGSFTGAVDDRAGLVESAAGGTLFLDEVAEMPAGLQAAVLRVIQEKEVRRVGESRIRNVDVRFIFATNSDIRELVSSGCFRKDLYFRICGLKLEIAPLRKRREDILPLFLHFLRRSAKAERTGTPRLSVAASDQILSYSWPGNVRELINETERIVALYRGTDIIDREMFSRRVRGNGNLAGCGEEPTMTQAVEKLERMMIREALERHRGNRSKSARELGISRQGLLNKIKRYKIEKNSGNTARR